MDRIKMILRGILFPHAVIIALLVPVSIVFLVYSFIAFEQVSAPSILAYVLSAYAITVVSLRIPDIIRFLKRIKNENAYVIRYRTDPHLRVNISLYSTFAYNSAYAIFQLCLGFYHHTVWYYSFAVYYILLAAMRFFLLRYMRTGIPGENMKEEFRRYRACGVVLVFMHLALSIIVSYITWQNKTFSHHEITTIAMAAYTFIAFTFAVINVIRYRKYQSPIFSAAKVLSFASALVSMLTLEGTMLNTFGESGQETFSRWMLGLTGAVVVLSVLLIAIFMIVISTKELKALKTKT